MRSVRNDPRVLSFHLHGFLNTNLTDDAWEIFDGVEGETGLEVWRLLNLDLTQTIQSEILSLEYPVVRPQRLKSLQEIPKGFLVWDHAYRSYTEAGGAPLDDRRTVGCIMRFLPQSIRERVFMKFEGFHDKPMAIRKWFQEKIKLIGHWEDPVTKIKQTRPARSCAP